MAADDPSNLPPSLKGAEWIERPETQAVMAALNKGNVIARAVGGAVRNTLLGEPVHDIDIATTSLPEETAQLAQRAGLKSVPSGLGHGTLTVIAGYTPFEVTTLRRDVETDGRRARVAFTGDWAEDARRRDFTLNALYCDANGKLFDPLGGYADLLARRIRFIGEASERIREDYLRILRFFRFTSGFGGGDMDAAGLAACRAEREGLTRLSRERIRAELLRLLATPHVTKVMPALADDFLPLILPQQADVNLLGRIVPIEAALGKVADPLLRLGALTGARPGGAVALKDALRLSTVEYERLARMAMPDRGFDPSSPEREARAFIYRHGSQAFVDGALIAWARGLAPPDDPAYAARLALPERWHTPKLPLRGSDITSLGVSPGPRVGRILAAFEDWWIEQDFPLDPSRLSARLAKIISSPDPGEPGTT